jgi:BirA family transcriptional regulator, biotin operon repressor / biotin---[acetyl-CoA-carboxylase] ligase
MAYQPEAPLTLEVITATLGPNALPRTILYHETIGSTMDLARSQLQQLPVERLPILVVADEQTAGRGRQGRSWVAPPGTALLTSLALRPDQLPAAQGVALIWMLAVALCEAIEELTHLRPWLKWPNDLLLYDPAVGWAKAAGMLLEVNLRTDRVEWAILGCGINVYASPPVGSTNYPATNLAAAGAAVTRLQLLEALLRHTEPWYHQVRRGETHALFAAWRTRLHTLGQTVTITTSQGRFSGLAEAVTTSGSLLVRDADGWLHTITTGDVGLVGV